MDEEHQRVQNIVQNNSKTRLKTTCCFIINFNFNDTHIHCSTNQLQNLLIQRQCHCLALRRTRASDDVCLIEILNEDRVMIHCFKYYASTDLIIAWRLKVG